MPTTFCTHSNHKVKEKESGKRESSEKTDGVAKREETDGRRSEQAM